MFIVESDQERETPGDARREFESLVRWWTDLRERGKVIASGKLAPSRTAVTVSWRRQVPIVTDGPYVETKEAVAGLALLDVASRAEAIEIASSWSPSDRFRIEVRAMEGP
jgi:hypothetical protein